MAFDGPRVDVEFTGGFTIAQRFAVDKCVVVAQQLFVGQSRIKDRRGKLLAHGRFPRAVRYLIQKRRNFFDGMVKKVREQKTGLQILCVCASRCTNMVSNKAAPEYGEGTWS